MNRTEVHPAGGPMRSSVQRMPPNHVSQATSSHSIIQLETSDSEMELPPAHLPPEQRVGPNDDLKHNMNGDAVRRNSLQQQQQYRPQESWTNDVGDDHDHDDSTVLMVLPSSLWAMVILAIVAVLLGATGTALGIANLVQDNNSRSASSSVQAGTDGSTSTLEVILERGYINCGTGPANSPGFLLETGTDAAGDPVYGGMEYDWCVILASALFNGEILHKDTNAPRYRIVPLSFVDRWTALAQGEIDVLLGVTYNMERDVYEPSAQVGFEFSFPYFLDGLTFGGLPEYLACAQALDFNSTDTCRNTQICVDQGTTHETILAALVPPYALQVVTRQDVGFPSACQVLAGETGRINSQAMKEGGYFGPYELGSQLLSREPISMATRSGDPRWSDFVEWMVQALIFAEEQEITQARSFRMAPTSVFGGNETHPHPQLQSMFENAIAVRGNYGELYNFNLQSFLPRGGMNRLNAGDSPIMYSFPLGDTLVEAPELEVSSPTVRAIKERGFLNCGMNQRRGFASFEPSARTWTGFDIDLCHAIAAALFDGSDSRVVVTDLPSAQRFSVLQDGRVDILARLTTWTLDRDVREPTTGQGLSFSYPYFHDGLKFGGVGQYADCANNLDVISPECQDLKVCLLEDTTILSRVEELFHSGYIYPKSSFADIISALNTGECNSVAGGFHDVDATGVRLDIDLQSIADLGYSGSETYRVGEKVYSKDPLALTTRQDDPLWSDFVRWIFWALVHAEEQGITQATAHDMPQTKLFGPLRTNALYHAVNAVGNYGEIYERHFGNLVPRGTSSLHQLNSGFGPMLRALPGIQLLS